MRNVHWNSAMPSADEIEYEVTLGKRRRARFGDVHAIARADNCELCTADLYFSFLSPRAE